VVWNVNGADRIYMFIVIDHVVKDLLSCTFQSVVELANLSH